MTRDERDAAIRQLRERLADAEEGIAAAVTELWQHQETFQALVDLCGGLRHDDALRGIEHRIPEIPTRARLDYLLRELRRHRATAVECRALLRQAGLSA